MVKKLKIKPLADRVVVKPLEEIEQKKGGIIIPDTAKEKPQQGEIVAVGPGRVIDEAASGSRPRSRSATRCSTASTPAARSRSRMSSI